MSQIPATEKIFGTTTLTDYKASMIKKTYALLTVGVVSAFAGGYIGVSNESIIRLFSGFYGWILAMVLINVIPRIALWSSTNGSKFLSVALLAVDGFVSGLVLAPLLYVAQLMATSNGESPNDLVFAAMGITASVFIAVTGYIFISRKRFSGKAGLLTGIFFVLIAVTALNVLVFPGLGIMGLLISAGIGIFGVIMLIYSTSSVLHDPNFLNPYAGALMLFAALFNLFVSALNIILRLFNGGRD